MSKMSKERRYPPIQNEEEYHETYKGREISIEREGNHEFYIMVTAPCGMYDYDGWWENDTFDDRTPMKLAVEQAIKGAVIA